MNKVLVLGFTSKKKSDSENLEILMPPISVDKNGSFFSFSTKLESVNISLTRQSTY
jgi:hypothetical protein